MKQPREYQDWAHQSLWNFIHTPEHYGKNPLVVMATGLGKSLNIAMFCTHMLHVYPSVRVMNLTHVKELVKGNYEELVNFWPAAPAGVYAAGLGETNSRSQITFAMINSVYKRPATFGHIDFILIDEAHRMSDNDKAMYGKFIDKLREKNPNLVVIGFTATPFRMGTGMLTDGNMFDDVVYDIGSGESFLWAVEQGYLIMPIPTDPGFELDDSGIAISAGDFKQTDASNAMHEQNIIERALDYSILLAREENRKCAVAFAQSIDDSELIAEILTYKGYPTEAVHSKRDDRDQVLEAHKRGELWGVSNKDILTTGWNNPLIDLFIGLRLTRSPGLWVQMVGRTTRPIWLPGFDITTREGRWASIYASGKLNSRILDFTGNTKRLGPINYPNLPKRRGAGGGDQPVRTCDYNKNEHPPGAEPIGCVPATYHHVSVKVCPHCGYVFPKESNLRAIAGTDDIVTATNPLGLPPPPEKQFEVFSVHEMTAVHNTGKDIVDKETGQVTGKKLDTVKVTYRSGHDYFRAWICFEHKEKSFPRRKAEQWWRDHGGNGPAPTDCSEAAEIIGSLRLPKFIKVWVNTDLPEIVGYDFLGTRFETPEDLNAAPVYHEPEPDPLEGRGSHYTETPFYDDDIPF